MSTPGWLDSAVFYQIYPQSFCDANGDGIGDLAGIVSKLDYLADLGINAIWMNPCYVSPFRDAGYDIVDHCGIDPRYGTLEDMDRLIAAAHGRGIRICLDLVPGHTSDQHPWFLASQRPERNEFTDRYVWSNDPWMTRDGDLEFLRGNADRMGAYAVNFFAHQPALNYGFAEPRRSYQQRLDDPGPRATADALRQIMAYWLDRGIDGFRVDVAGTVVKGDPARVGVRKFWRGIAHWMRARFPDRILIAEWGQPELAVDGGFDVDFLLHFGTPGYDALMLGPATFPRARREPYFDAEGRGDFASFYDSFAFQRERVAGRGFVGLPSSNHDMSRPSVGRDPADLKVLYTFLLTWPVVPFIYYGDEIGMRYLPGLPSKEGGFERTGSRTPMQWQPGALAGFSSAPSATPYLPLDPTPDRPDVASARADKDSLWHHLERLIYLRVTEGDLAASAALDILSDVPADGPAGYPLVYRRGTSLVVAINPGPSNHRQRLAGIGDVAPVLGHHCELHRDAGGWYLRIGARGYGIFTTR